MTKRELKQKIKSELKEVANEIRFAKSVRKPKNYDAITDEQRKKYSAIIERPWRLDSIRWNYRQKHIAYCMFFNNTPYKKIEVNCKQPPYFKSIDKMQETWQELIDEPEEALRDCAA